MVVQSTGNDFRVAVPRWRKGVSFHIFTLQEDRCVRLLMKNLRRGMPENFVREELEALDIHVQGIIQLVPVVATRTHPRTALLPLTHCISCAGPRRV
jgi:hypothetical protein